MPLFALLTGVSLPAFVVAGAAAGGGGAGPGAGKAFAEGLVVQLANPKAAVFMLAFYPQFVPSDQPLFASTALLAALQVCLELCVYLTLAWFVARAGAWFRRSTVRRRLEAVSGTVLVGLGLRVGLAPR